MPHQQGKPDWTGGNPGLNPGKGGGSGNPNPGDTKGDLFGDQIVLYRDLTLNGAPLLDENDQLIAVGYDPTGAAHPGAADDGLFPIYAIDIEGDYEFPPGLVPYLQEVELERANVARAPAKVAEKALLAAIDKIEGAYDAHEADEGSSLEDYITTDPAGRIMYRTDTDSDFSTIDAPLENLALYQALMTAGTSGSWPEVQEDWGVINVAGSPYDLSMLADLANWDPSALIGAAWSKEGTITLDALLYENTTLGVNEVTNASAPSNVDYFNFNEDGGGESFDYSRVKYQDVWLRWYEDTDTDPTDLEVQYFRVWDAVFGERNEHGVDRQNTGEDWDDVYLQLDTNSTEQTTDDDFVFVSAENAGVNDFAQAADDTRAIIEFIHSYGAVEVSDAEVIAAGQDDAGNDYYYNIA